MELTDVIIDSYYKVDKVCNKRIVASKRRGISKDNKKYISIYTLLMDIMLLRVKAHEAIKHDNSGDIYWTTGQDVTKWFGTQLVYRLYGNKLSKIPPQYWNLINNSLEGDII